MKKNFVFDTNVLLTDPRAMHKFEDNNIIIPITVLEELDKFKRDLNDVGRNAREVSRMMDHYRSQGSLAQGVQLESGGMLRVLTDIDHQTKLPFPTLGKTADSLILAAAMRVRDADADVPCVFVTRDINLRLRADALKLKAVTYEEKDVAPPDEMYKGEKKIELPPETFDRYDREREIDSASFDLLPNQSVVFIREGEPDRVVLGRHYSAEGKVRGLLGQEGDLWGIRPRNIEQAFAIDLLLDPNLQLISLAGKAGTGKTLLAIAAGLHMTADEDQYSKLVVARPIMPLGKELGFLPGEVSEKLNPWMGPIYDNLDLIMGARAEKEAGIMAGPGTQPKARKQRRERGESAQSLIDMGLVEIQALTYIRGRSLPGQYMIIDEAQNLNLLEIKTIITRAGEGTKIVLTGDPYQIDNPYLDSNSNGLSVVAERFKTQPLAGHIMLVQGERSMLAETASELL